MIQSISSSWHFSALFSVTGVFFLLFFKKKSDYGISGTVGIWALMGVDPFSSKDILYEHIPWLCLFVPLLSLYAYILGTWDAIIDPATCLVVLPLCVSNWDYLVVVVCQWSGVKPKRITELQTGMLGRQTGSKGSSEELQGFMLLYLLCAAAPKWCTLQLLHALILQKCMQCLYTI